MRCKKFLSTFAFATAAVVALQSIAVAAVDSSDFYTPCLVEPYNTVSESNISNIDGDVGPFVESDESVIQYVSFDDDIGLGSAVASFTTVNKQASVADLLSRDWSIYSSDYFESKMTTNELTYYNRFESLAQSYMTSTADVSYSSTYKVYLINGVRYSDLGLTSTEAYNVAQWFVYNNPQYYFLKPGFVTTSSAVYISCYDVAADGDDRAKLSAEVFSTVDSWIESVTDDEVTVYQKAVAIHDLLCDKLEYKKGYYDQSLYSVTNLGETVCAGYAGAYSLMANAVGIDTIVALSDSHAWDYVQLGDGQYYQTDVTWNDRLSVDKLLNCGSKTITWYDSSTDEHAVEPEWTDWLPVASYDDYIVTDYDLTGSFDPSMTLGEPSNLKVDYLSNSIAVTWDAVKWASAYDVELYSGSSLLKSLSVNTNTVNFSDIFAYDDLMFKVRSVAQADGSYYYSGWKSIDFSPVNTLTPAVPTAFKVESISDTSVTLTWTGVANADKYTVEIYSDAGYTSCLGSATNTQTSLVLSNMANRTIYARLCAVRTVGGHTYQSDWVKLTVTGSSATSKLDVPTSLKAVKSGNLCLMSWDAVSGASKYELQVCSNSTYSKVLASTSLTTTSLNLSGLVDNYTYYIRVRASKVVSGQTYYSDWATTTYKSTITTASSLSAPANFKSYKQSSLLNLSWSAVTGAKGYEIQICSDSAYKKVLVSSKLTSTVLNLSGLRSGATYYIRIRAYSGSTYSAWSNMSVTF